MSVPSRPEWIKVEEFGDITVVTFLDSKLLDAPSIPFREDLFRRMDESGSKKVLLNFAHVEFWSSAVLGLLISLHRKLQALDGKMLFCNVNEDLLEVFGITNLGQFFFIIPEPVDLESKPDLTRYFE